VVSGVELLVPWYCPATSATDADGAAVATAAVDAGSGSANGGGSGRAQALKARLWFSGPAEKRPG